MSAQTATKERRRHRRVHGKKECGLFCYRSEDDRPTMSRCRLIDISACGAACTGRSPPPLQTQGELTLQFPGFRFVTEARVVRTWEGGFAVEFADFCLHGVEESAEEDVPE